MKNVRYSLYSVVGRREIPALHTKVRVTGDEICTFIRVVSPKSVNVGEEGIEV